MRRCLVIVTRQEHVDRMAFDFGLKDPLYDVRLQQFIKKPSLCVFASMNNEADGKRYFMLLDKTSVGFNSMWVSSDNKCINNRIRILIRNHLRELFDGDYPNEDLFLIDERDVVHRYRDNDHIMWD